MSDRFPIPAETHRAEEEIQRSRFIATLGHARSSEEARGFLARIREEFPQANHHCWAFVVGPPGSSDQIGAGDDGEPSGTAGRPMLKVLSHSGVGEIVAVVTRFFGGVKLGTGGLVRAYSGVVRYALDTLPVKEKVTLVRFTLLLAYASVDPVKRKIPEFEGVILGEEFGADVQFQVELPEDRIAACQGAITELTNGEALFE